MPYSDVDTSRFEDIYQLIAAAGLPLVDVVSKVLLSALHFGFLRNFESVIGGLAERGHDVVLAADEEEDLGGRQLAVALAARPDGRVR